MLHTHQGKQEFKERRGRIFKAKRNNSKELRETATLFPNRDRRGRINTKARDLSGEMSLMSSEATRGPVTGVEGDYNCCSLLHCSKDYRRSYCVDPYNNARMVAFF